MTIKELKGLSVLALVAALFIAIGFAGHEAHRADVAHAQAAALAQDLDLQNRAVMALQARAEQREADMAARVKAAVSAAQAGRKEASKTVASLKAAKPGADKCDSALKLIQGVDQ